jgi:hypothetical protein
MDRGAGGASGTGGAAGTGGRAGGAGSTGTGGVAAADAGRDTGAPRTDAGSASPIMNFFVTSDTHPNGNLGGLTGADQRCQTLAAAVGQGSKTWHGSSCANPVPAGGVGRIYCFVGP